MKRAFFLMLVVIAGWGSAIAIHTAPIAHAQASTAPLTLTLNPTYPKPFDVVTVSVDSTVLDLAASTITISANGAIVNKGSGALTAGVQLGAAGTQTTVKVTAVSGGQTYSTQTTIVPADVSLIAEPVSTTHPFYRGAPLIASEGGVRLIAVPDLRTSGGSPIPSTNLVYTWKNGDQVLESQSGIGKSVLTVTAPVRYRDATISVTVATQDSSIVANAAMTVTPSDPLIRIYQNDPLLGPLFNSALGRAVTMGDSEDTFRAVPYFFSEVPAIEWDVNGTPSESSKDITVRPTGNGAGTAELTVTATQQDTSQSANSALTVLFGGAKSLGIFGL
jgi:ribosomal protein L31